MANEPIVNDLVVKFANVNGSGSASANLLFAKTLFRMGIPVSAKNIFPSNIQGLPTWYEVRVSESGYMARREGVDIMIAMNPQTYDEDLAELLPGGVLIFDSTWPRRWSRDDVTIVPIPIAQMCAKAYSDVRQRQLFKNIVYIGALSALLDMDFEAMTTLVHDQFAGKSKLIEPNVQALKMGREYAQDNLGDRPLRQAVRASDAAKGKILVNGNRTAGLGAVYAGATVCAWYPITPSTSLAEEFERYLKHLRRDADGRTLGAVIQAEDELAAIGIAIGANWNGARAFTTTSGPGISLMSEFIGLAYFAEVPLVLYDIQRGGPSTGMPTRTQQSDILLCAYASHGDTKHVLLFPCDPNECFTFSAEAFNLAERLQTPIFFMSDLDIGMNDWVAEPLVWDDSKPHDRGKVLDAAALDAMEDWGRYRDVDGDGIGYRTLPGAHPTKGAYFTRGSSHDENARYTEDGKIHAGILDRLTRKFKTAESMVPEPVIREHSNSSKIAIINYGSTEAAICEAIDELSARGHGLNHMRIRAFPFNQSVRSFIESHSFVFVVEQNRDGQMRKLLSAELEVAGHKLISILNYDGMPMTAAFVREAVLEVIAADEAVARASAAPITAA
jgi:2-oxoglutarate ferredoxin oxidoreductase subunit alpha